MLLKSSHAKFVFDTRLAVYKLSEFDSVVYKRVVVVTQSFSHLVDKPQTFKLHRTI